MELLHDWEKTGYTNDIGPGVYDIHSPRVPTVEEMVELLHEVIGGTKGNLRSVPRKRELARLRTS